MLVRERLVAATAAAPILAGLTKTEKRQLTQLLQACLDGNEARAVS